MTLLDQFESEIQAVLRGERRQEPTAAPMAVVHDEIEPQTLGEVRALLGDCERCALCKSREKIVFGVGPDHPDFLIVGEAPGQHEDEIGEPFVGKAGVLLDKMMGSVLKRTREQVYICNILKCRPPDNRDPIAPEIEACLPFLLDQIRILAPPLILIMGSIATKVLLRSEYGVTRNRNVWHEVAGIPALVTYHPANLLRQETNKRYAYEDLLTFQRRLDKVE